MEICKIIQYRSHAVEITDSETTEDKQPGLHPMKAVKRKIVNELKKW